MPFECIDISQAKTLIDESSAVVIDIRDPASYEAGHIEKAIHVDNTNIQTFIEDNDKNLPLIVCCYHGNMSKGAADFFCQQGFDQSYSLDGGYSEWAKQE